MMKFSFNPHLNTIVACACLLALIRSSNGDEIEQKEGTIYGKISGMTATDVTIAEGNDKRKLQLVAWKSINRIVINNQFKLPTIGSSFHGLSMETPPCKEGETNFLRISFKKEGQAVYASGTSLDKKGLRITLANGTTVLAGPIGDVTVITPKKFCRESIPVDIGEAKWPPSFKKIIQ